MESPLDTAGLNRIEVYRKAENETYAMRLRVSTWIWLVAGRLLLFGAFLFAAVYWSGFLIDDAFISLRYARNLAEGHGLVFNPGERVEGYTNFLWVMLAAGAFRVGLDAMFVLRALSALAATGLVALVWRRDRAAGPLLLGLPALAFWSITGMESMAFAFLLLLAWTLLWRESEPDSETAASGQFRPSTAVFVLLALTRPEGVPLFALCHGLVWLAMGPSLRTLRRHVVDGLGFAVAYGVYFAWRYSYYGEIFPNTYYAKVTGGAEQWKTGLRAFTDWASAHPAFALALVAVPVLLIARRTRDETWTDRKTLALWAFCAAYSLYVVSVGGDFMPFFRFFLPLAAFFALLTARLLRRLPNSAQMPTLAAILTIQLVAGLWNDQPERAFVAHRTTVVGAEVGRTLADLYEPDDLLAVNTAGSLPFEARMPTVDMLGLTDAAIARHPVYVTSTGWAGHRRGWGEYVVSRRPKAVLWYNSAGLATPHYLSDHQLADDPFFRFFYQRKTLEVSVDGEGEGDVLGRFFGWPSHEGVSGDSALGKPSRSPELGSTFVARRFLGVLPYTVARADQVRIVWFERRADPDDLWQLYDASDRDVDRFLDLVVARWTASFEPSHDVEARAEVDGMAQQAARLVQMGEVFRAKELLAIASRRNEAARSPLVYQYVANLAVMDDDIFLAVQAQREALRLDPGNGLYRENLRGLLRRPFGE